MDDFSSTAHYFRVHFRRRIFAVPVSNIVGLPAHTFGAFFVKGPTLAVLPSQGSPQWPTHAANSNLQYIRKWLLLRVPTEFPHPRTCHFRQLFHEGTMHYYFFVPTYSDKSTLFSLLYILSCLVKNVKRNFPLYDRMQLTSIEKYRRHLCAFVHRTIQIAPHPFLKARRTDPGGCPRGSYPALRSPRLFLSIIPAIAAISHHNFAPAGQCF